MVHIRLYNYIKDIHCYIVIITVLYSYLRTLSFISLVYRLSQRWFVIELFGNVFIWWECLCCKEIKSVEITTNYINVFLTKIFFGLDKILCLKVFQSSYLHQTTNSQTTRSSICCSTAHQSSRLSSRLEKLVGLSGLFFLGIWKIFLLFEPTWKSLVFK